MFDVSLFLADLKKSFVAKDWKLIKAIIASLQEYEDSCEHCGSEN